MKERSVFLKVTGKTERNYVNGGEWRWWLRKLWLVPIFFPILFPLWIIKWANNYLHKYWLSLEWNFFGVSLVDMLILVRLTHNFWPSDWRREQKRSRTGSEDARRNQGGRDRWWKIRRCTKKPRKGWMTKCARKGCFKEKDLSLSWYFQETRNWVPRVKGNSSSLQLVVWVILDSRAATFYDTHQLIPQLVFERKARKGKDGRKSRIDDKKKWERWSEKE